MAKKPAKRELIDTGSDKRFVRARSAGAIQRERRCRTFARAGREDQGKDEGERGPRRQGRQATFVRQCLKRSIHRRRIASMVETAREDPTQRSRQREPAARWIRHYR